MDIVTLHTLNASQKTEIEELVKVCLREEGLERTLYLEHDLNFYSNLTSFYLRYSNEKLVSVLTILQQTKDEAEISAYTLPSERKKGFFSELLDYAIDELAGFGINRVIFIIEAGSLSGNAVIELYDTCYVKSEYLLTAALNHTLFSENPTELTLTVLGKDKFDEAVYLSNQIFQNSREDTLYIIKTAMDTRSMKCYGAVLDGKLIGIGNVNYGASEASLYGFGIAPEYQGRGLGKNFLRLLFDKIKKESCLTMNLEVSSESPKALSLYLKEGFQVKSQYDYYEYIIV